MPQFDGTGPDGQGPGTGRGRGTCHGFGSICKFRKPPGKLFFSLALATVGLIVKDAANPKGITRKVLHTLGDCLAGRLRKPEPDKDRVVRTVEAEILSAPRRSIKSAPGPGTT